MHFDLGPSDPDAPLARVPEREPLTKTEVVAGFAATIVVCLSLSILIGVLVWMAQIVWGQVLG